MSDSTSFQLTTADALKMFRKAPAGSRFCIHLRADAPIEGGEQHYPGGCHGSLRITKAQALRILADFLSPVLEAKGARIPLSTNPAYDGATYYWIG